MKMAAATVLILFLTQAFRSSSSQEAQDLQTDEANHKKVYDDAKTKWADVYTAYKWALWINRGTITAVSAIGGFGAQYAGYVCWLNDLGDKARKMVTTQRGLVAEESLVLENCLKARNLTAEELEGTRVLLQEAEDTLSDIAGEMADDTCAMFAHEPMLLRNLELLASSGLPELAEEEVATFKQALTNFCEAEANAATAEGDLVKQDEKVRGLTMNANNRIAAAEAGVTAADADYARWNEWPWHTESARVHPVLRIIAYFVGGSIPSGSLLVWTDSFLKEYTTKFLAAEKSCGDARSAYRKASEARKKVCKGTLPVLGEDNPMLLFVQPEFPADPMTDQPGAVKTAVKLAMDAHNRAYGTGAAFAGQDHSTPPDMRALGEQIENVIHQQLKAVQRELADAGLRGDDEAVTENSQVAQSLHKLLTSVKGAVDRDWAASGAYDENQRALERLLEQTDAAAAQAGETAEHQFARTTTIATTNPFERLLRPGLPGPFDRAAVERDVLSVMRDPVGAVTGEIERQANALNAEIRDLMNRGVDSVTSALGL